MIAQRMVNQRLAPSSIEARGVVAHYEPGRETLNIWLSTRNPHILHTFLAQTLGLGQDRVRAIARPSPRRWGAASAPRSTSTAREYAFRQEAAAGAHDVVDRGRTYS